MLNSRPRVPSARELLPMQCRCCGGTNVRLVIDLGDQPLCNRLVRADTPVGAETVYPLRLGYCEDCTMMQIDHTIPRDDMFREYVYVSGTTETLGRHFKATTERLAATYSVQPDDLVVDIGSNDGTWLKCWAGRAYALGVEPATEIARAASYSGVMTLNRYFDLATAEFISASHFATKADDAKAKIITSAGSFFHMEDLHGACEGVKRLLAPDGVFVVQAIDGTSMILGNAFDQVLHEHLLYYTQTSFAELMARHDMEVFDFHTHTIHGGTNEFHVCHKGARPVRVDFLKTRSGVTYADCADFAQRVLKMRSALLETLHQYKAAGKSVWAYGAPGKGATLLNSFGIGRDLVQCAVEKNPLKFGLSIPGCRIPIIPENGLYQPRAGGNVSIAHPDAYLVLAWNFLPEFIEKESDFLNNGGEFIVPVPEVRVIGGRQTSAVAAQ